MTVGKMTKTVVSTTIIFCVTAVGPVTAAVPEEGENTGCAFVAHSIRVTSPGDRIEGVLYVPHRSDGREVSSSPVLILLHGFSRDYGRHAANAIHYTCAGFVTYTPNLVPVNAVGSDDERQVANVVDHVKWLRARALDPTDPLYGVADPQRIVLGGHSAGGAVSVEALEGLQNEAVPVSGLILLDAVPHERTLEAAAKLMPIPILSIRSRPGPCNAYGSARTLEGAIPFPITSFFVPSATHCDPESPTDIVCRLLCGGTSEEARVFYRERVLEFLQEIFAPSSLRSLL